MRGAGSFAAGLSMGLDAGQARKDRRRELEQQAQQIATLGQNVSAGAYDGAPVGARGLGPASAGVRGASVAPVAAPLAPDGAAAGARGRMPVANATSGGLFGLIDRTEGGGNYSTLFGHSQRDGGQFSGTDVSSMTLGQLREFANPRGEYGRWVRDELARIGQTPRIATPMGRHQIVGTTLFGAAAQMGLGDDTVFDRSTQDAVANHLARRGLAGASTMAGKMRAMRSEWEGFRNVSDADLSAAIRQFEGQS